MSLSPKEIKVLSLVALGFSDKEIGVKLKISYGTVRTHINKIILKLNARNRSNAILIYKIINKEWLEEFYETYNNTLDSRKLLPNKL